MERLDRVLELGERWLRRRLGASPEPGFFAPHHAFRWEASAEGGWLVPVAEPRHFDLADLVGVDDARERLVRNTEQFVRGLPSNHVLLHGERGTGKSSAVRGLLSRFAGDCPVGFSAADVGEDAQGVLAQRLAHHVLGVTSFQHYPGHPR